MVWKEDGMAKGRESLGKVHAKVHAKLAPTVIPAATDGVRAVQYKVACGWWLGG